MPLGIVSESDFQKEIDNCVPVDRDKTLPITGEVVSPKESGRGEGKSNIPESIRKLIGEEYAIEGASAGRLLAQELGISASSASAYGNGAHSTASYHTPTEVKTHIDTKKERIVKRASSRILKALDSITDDKLVLTKASELASIAKNLSGVVRDMEPDNKDDRDKGPQIQFVMFAPKLMTEDRFGETLQVNE